MPFLDFRQRAVEATYFHLPNHKDEHWSCSTKSRIVSVIENNLRQFCFALPFARVRACYDGVPKMCDYSLQSVKSRPAKVGDKLTTRNFGTGTRGFAASEDTNVAVCV